MSPALRLFLLLAPTLLLGVSAGALRAWAGLPTHPPRRRRLLQVAWVALLLAGTPAWLVLAALLGLW